MSLFLCASNGPWWNSMKFPFCNKTRAGFKNSFLLWHDKLMWHRMQWKGVKFEFLSGLLFIFAGDGRQQLFWTPFVKLNMQTTESRFSLLRIVLLFVDSKYEKFKFFLHLSIYHSHLLKISFHYILSLCETLANRLYCK